MTLKEKKIIEKIADDFAIGFLEWGFDNYNIIKSYDLKLLLIKYKEEQYDLKKYIEWKKKLINEIVNT